MSDEVVITFQGKSSIHPVVPASLGRSVVDISDFMQQHPLFMLDKGFKTTASYRSDICFIDGEQGELLYRGYPIEEIAEKTNFLTVCYLLFYGELPTKDGLYSFVQKMRSLREVPDFIQDILASLPHTAHPMSILSTLTNALGSTLDPHIDHLSVTSRQDACAHMMAKMPILVAMTIRHCNKLPPIAPSSSLPYVQNFLYMMTGEMPSDAAVAAMEVILILHAEHEQNASTSTVRAVGSTGAGPVASLAAGICALSGPAHGGANEACIHMLEEIQSVDNIEEYIAKSKDKSDPFRLMGFGHRVYKNYDPRAKIMQKLCHAVLKDTESDPLFQLATALEQKALEDPYFITKKLYPNVDYYSGITQKALGIPSNCFTTIFALARCAGWMAHWSEMHEDSSNPIFRPRQLYQGPKRRTVL